MLNPDLKHDMKTYFGATDAALADVETVVSQLRFQEQEWEVSDEGISLVWFHKGKGMATVHFPGNGKVFTIVSPGSIGIPAAVFSVSDIGGITKALEAMVDFTGPVTPFYPRGRIVELSELTEEDIAKITAKLPPGPDDYNLEDLDDDGNLEATDEVTQCRTI